MGEFAGLCDLFESVIVPYYKFLYYGDVIRNLMHRYSGTSFILSSVMPDTWLKRVGIVDEFIKFAEMCGFRKVIVWDYPTYLGNKETSFRGVKYALSVIDRFSDDFNVIPLIKGAYPEHIEYCCEELISKGFDSAAFHISEYLSSKLKPWPHVDEFSLTAVDYMYKLLEIILDYSFKEILLLGGASPRFYRNLLDLDERIIVSGFSWYIDAANYQLYDTSGRIINLKNKFYICNCRICSSVSKSRLRRVKNMAMHNLLINKVLVEEGDAGHIADIDIYDLVLDTHENLIVVNGLRVGSPFSLWRRVLWKAMRLKPTYLVLMGDVFHFEEADKDEYKDFITFLLNICNRTNIITVSPYMARDRWLLNIVEIIMTEGIKDLVVDKFKIMYEEDMLELLLRFFVTTKRQMKIKKYSWVGEQEIYIKLYGVVDTPFEEAKKLLKDIALSKGWLITDYINKPYIDREARVATPGECNTLWQNLEKPAPGMIHVTREGDIKLIELSVK